MENVPVPPPIPQETATVELQRAPLTLIQTLNEKLGAARARQAVAEQDVKNLEDEIDGIPEHMRDLTYSDMMGKVEAWYRV